MMHFVESYKSCTIYRDEARNYRILNKDMEFEPQVFSELGEAHEFIDDQLSRHIVHPSELDGYYDITVLLSSTMSDGHRKILTLETEVNFDTELNKAVLGQRLKLTHGLKYLRMFEVGDLHGAILAYNDIEG